VIRAVADSDADSIIALIAGCWAEYPGCVMDVDNENPELRAFATHCARKGGAGWIAAAGTGMIATYPLDDRAWEISRMYVAATARGTGLAHALLDLAEARAACHGATRLELWTDTRFTRAHRFYEKRGYARQPGIRALHDLSNSEEFHYLRVLHGGDAG
jgi:GNAT superfamily N-acetyltransferase